MSSVPGRYPDNPFDPNNSSSMPSAALNRTPRAYDRIPDRHSQPHMNPHAANQAQRAHRLPPPQSLEAGVPCAPDPFRTHSQDQFYFSTPPHGYHSAANPLAPSSQLSPLPLPLPSPSHIPHPTSASQSYPARNVPAPAQPPQTFAPVAVGRSEYSPSPRPSRFPPSTEPAQPPHPPLPRPYLHRPEAGILLDNPQPDQQAPKPAPAIKRQPPMAAHPSSRPQKSDGGSVATRIPNLLGANRSQALAGVDFRLRMRQQPNAARACGFGDRDRRVIDPPPIVELVIEGSGLTREEIRTYLRYESYVMSCAIYDESGTRDSSYMPEEYQHQRRLMGSLVATPFVGQDENGSEGCFFCFSDLSCRTPGSFRLKFILMMIDPSRAGVVRHFPILAEIKSEPFRVYSAKEFPGMMASSKLAKRLKEQGCIISIKKGNDRAKNARGQDELSDINDEDDEDDDDDGQGQRKRRAMRN